MKIFILILAVLSAEAHAFNLNKCKRTYPNNRNRSWQVVALGNMIGMSTSSAEFISSTGNCAMIGQIEHEKKMFIVTNFDKMKEDLTKGNGDHDKYFANTNVRNTRCKGYVSRWSIAYCEE